MNNVRIPLPSLFLLMLLTICCASSSAANEKLNTADITPPVSGNQLTPDAIKPSDVYARLRLFQSLMQPLAQHMGKQTNLEALVTIKDIEPREVIFMIHGLRIKTRRLAHQLGFESPAVPEFAYEGVQTIKPYHVFLQTDEAVNSIRSLIHHLGLKPQVMEHPANSEITPSDVFSLALTIQRNLNQLFITPIQQSDVYALVTQSINLTANLISASKHISPYPEEQSVTESFVTESMIYHKAIAIQNKLAAMIFKNEVNKFKINPSTNNTLEKELTASDSFDVMLGVLAELYYLNQAQSKEALIPPYYPGVKFPKDTLQRLHLLEQQITML